MWLAPKAYIAQLWPRKAQDYVQSSYGSFTGSHVILIGGTLMAILIVYIAQIIEDKCISLLTESTRQTCFLYYVKEYRSFLC